MSYPENLIFQAWWIFQQVLLIHQCLLTQHSSLLLNYFCPLCLYFYGQWLLLSSFLSPSCTPYCHVHRKNIFLQEWASKWEAVKSSFHAFSVLTFNKATRIFPTQSSSHVWIHYKMLIQYRDMPVCHSSRISAGGRGGVRSLVCILPCCKLLFQLHRPLFTISLPKAESRYCSWVGSHSMWNLHQIRFFQWALNSDFSKSVSQCGSWWCLWVWPVNPM